ncbi:TPA: hypothetical protein ACIV42_003138 [Salmonella enterica subsp. enterica serovar Saintpaul]
MWQSTDLIKLIDPFYSLVVFMAGAMVWEKLKLRLSLRFAFMLALAVSLSVAMIFSFIQRELPPGAVVIE